VLSLSFYFCFLPNSAKREQNLGTSRWQGSKGKQVPSLYLIDRDLRPREVRMLTKCHPATVSDKVRRLLSI
jgi:hypothetical protein